MVKNVNLMFSGFIYFGNQIINPIKNCLIIRSISQFANKCFKLFKSHKRIGSEIFDNKTFSLNTGNRYFKISIDSPERKEEFFPSGVAIDIAKSEFELGLKYLESCDSKQSDKDAERSDKTAVKLFLWAANRGYTAAQHFLGLMYFEGRGGLEQSDEEAIRLFLLAANKGYAAGQYDLALMYFEGRGGLEQSDEEAVRYFLLAAKQGYADAQYELGLMYFEGKGGLEQLDEKAFNYFLLAANQNHPAAQHELALMHFEGRGGLEQSDEEAVKYLLLAANQGYAAAQYDLGLMHLAGRGGLEQLDEKAFNYFLLAANQNHSGAQFQVGYMYLEGLGIEPSNEKAMNYFHLAADQIPSALTNLGIMHENNQSHQEAFKYYLLAADQNEPNAQYHAGVCYLYGRGIEQSDEQAINYLILSAKNGHEFAKTLIYDFYYMPLSHQNKLSNEKNIEHLLKAAKEGYEFAHDILRIIYKRGYSQGSSLVKEVYEYYRLRINSQQDSLYIKNVNFEKENVQGDFRNLWIKRFKRAI